MANHKKIAEGTVKDTLEVVHVWTATQPRSVTPTVPSQAPNPRERPVEMLRGVESRVKADEIIHWLRDYAERRLNSRLIDERRCVPPYVVLDFGLRGLFGLQVPTNEGGAGLTTVDALRVFEQLAAIDLTLCLMVGIHNGLGLRPIQFFGQTLTTRDLLPILASGRQLAAFALSESAAGSNPNAIQTTAQRDGDYWIVRGEKRWIGLASWAGVITTFAKVIGAHGQASGMVALAIQENLPGLRHGPESVTMGVRGIVQNSVYFDGARVPDALRLGEPGDGMRVAQDAMMFCRMGLASISVGAMKRTAQLAARYAGRRSVATGRLLDNSVTLRRLEDIVAAASATEALVGEIAGWVDAGREVPLEAYVACKTTGPELLGQAVDILMQLLGGRGYEETSPVPQLLRDARLLRIFEGPTETLNGFLGSNVLQRGEGVRRLISDYLDQPDLAAELDAIGVRIRSAMNSGQLVHRIACPIGEVASAAILAAAARKRSTAGGLMSEAARWAAELFARTQAAALAAVARPLSSASALLDHVAGFTATIGDLEQLLPGEENRPDQLLSKSERFNISSERQLQAPGPITNNELMSAVCPTTEDRLTTAILDSLMKWLGREVDLPHTDINEDAPFATLGMDSVGAAGVAKEIEKATGIRLRPEVIYEYPTVKLLVEYLRSRITSEQLYPDHSRRKPRSIELPDSSLEGNINRRSLDPFNGSLADYSEPAGSCLEERVEAYTAWQNSRREAGVWPFYRIARSPASPSMAVFGVDETPGKWINFASQDYLGLAQDERVLRKAEEAVRQYGIHSAGSPVLLGITTPMAELERTLAKAIDKEDCLIFPTGWAAGFGVITGLVRAHDTLVLDARCHRCLMEGAYHITHEPILFQHNDLDNLAQILRHARDRHTTNGLFVVAESLYSMDSDSPDLVAMVKLVREFNAILILDVAHDFGSMGIRGLGLLEQLEGTGLTVDVVMGSFSKTFAATGGFVAAAQPVIDYLRGHTTSFVFSNAISPVQATAALECCNIAFSPEGRQLRNRLNDNEVALRSAMKAAGYRVEGIPSPIVPVFVGGEREARLAARQIARHGLLANLVEYPAVPHGQARFRFQVMSTHTREITQNAARLFDKACREAGIK